MIGENRDQADETARKKPTEDTPPPGRLQPVLNTPVQQERRGQAQSHRDPRERDEVDRIGYRRIPQDDRSDPESQDDDQQHGKKPPGRRERPRVVQERKERQQHRADDEQRGEQIDELDFGPGRDPGSLRRSKRGQGSRRFPRMMGTDWPPTRTTLGFPPSVSTLTSMRLAWWISIPCSITNVGAGSFPRKARYAPHAPAALPVAGSSIPRSGTKLRAWTAAPGVSPPRRRHSRRPSHRTWREPCRGPVGPDPTLSRGRSIGGGLGGMGCPSPRSGERVPSGRSRSFGPRGPMRAVRDS